MFIMALSISFSGGKKRKVPTYKAKKKNFIFPTPGVVPGCHMKTHPHV